MFQMNSFTKNALQLIGWLVGLSLLGYLLYTVRAMIVYLIIAGILTFLGKPVIRLLRKIPIGKKQIPLWVCSAVTIAAFLAVIGGALSLIGPAFNSEMRVLEKINYHQLFTQIENNFESAQGILSEWNIASEVAEFDAEAWVKDKVNSRTITSTFGTLVGGLGSISIAIFSIIFILFFFLKEERLADTAIDNFISDKYTEQIRHVVPKVKKTLSRYILGLTIQVVSIFLMVYIGLNIAGFDNVLIIALFAGMMNVIPYIGPLIGGGFGIILGLGQELAMNPEMDNFALTAGLLLTVFVVVQLIDNIISQPIIFSNSINAHPLEIFIVISIAGTVAGIAGMVVAVPLYSILRIVAKEFNVNIKFIQTLSKNA